MANGPPVKRAPVVHSLLIDLGSSTSKSGAKSCGFRYTVGAFGRSSLSTFDCCTADPVEISIYIVYTTCIGRLQQDGRRRHAQVAVQGRRAARPLDLAEVARPGAPSALAEEFSLAFPTNQKALSCMDAPRHGAGADWQYVGPMVTSARTPIDSSAAHEFVTSSAHLHLYLCA